MALRDPAPDLCGPVPDIQLARETLGAHLRALRRASSLNGKEFAARLGWPQSKVSKIETGRQAPSRADITRWAEAAGQPQAADALTAELAELELFYSDYRTRMRRGMRFRQREAAAAEEKMKVLRTFSSNRVPAFFQTADYARCMLTLGAKLYNAPDDVAEAVKVRMQRQHVLYHPGKQFHIVITEAVLRSCAVAPPQVMAAQLDRLVAATTLGPSIRFGVIPFSTPWPVFVDHGFWIYDTDTVIVETLAAELRLTRSDEIGLYRKAFDQLAQIASYGQDARTIITGALMDLGAEPSE
jgi:transcriptional regulator with XRE-family HTH domain